LSAPQRAAALNAAKSGAGARPCPGSRRRAGGSAWFRL